MAICSKSPQWYHGPEFKILAPKYDFFAAYKAGAIGCKEYIEEYHKKVLKHLDPLTVYTTITEIYGSDASLLCYEKPGDFCHRHIVALWFEENLGVSIPELSTIENVNSLIRFD